MFGSFSVTLFLGFVTKASQSPPQHKDSLNYTFSVKTRESIHARKKEKH